MSFLIDIMKDADIIKALPKAQLHVHLVGSIRPKTVWSFVEQGKVDTTYKSVDENSRLLEYQDFGHFIQTYVSIVDLITDEQQFERIAYEFLEDNARCNVQYVEASFSPADHTKRGLEFPKMIDAINQGIQQAEKDYGVKCNIRIDLVRNYGSNMGITVLNWIEEKPDNIVSIDIGGSEDKFPPKPYVLAYKRAKEMGLHLVAHAGEAAGPSSIWDAIKYLNVERIGHGTSAIHDESLMDYLKEKKIVIEACPVSNIRTGVVESLDKHPIRKFFDRGLIVTVNSDDPSLFGTDMNNEYMKIYENLGFTIPELMQLSLNAIDSAFISDEERITLRTQFLGEYENLKSEFNDTPTQ
jgi:adenosine deaminase